MSKLRVDKIAAPIVQDEFTGSVYFDGSGDYLSLPVSSDFQFGSDDFTIECWAYALDEGTDDILGIYNTGNDRRTFALRKDQTESVQFLFSSNGTSGTSISSAESIIQLRTWHHYAVVRRNLVYEIYFDGVKVATKSDSTDAIYTNNDDGLRIGSSYNTDFHGYISNARICKGHAVYTENFTPPTRELPVHKAPPKGVVFPAADNLTVLLACQSSTDATLDSSGRHTLTANGNVTAADANPGLLRKTNISSTITENTGSVYFDGGDDGLRSNPYDELTLGTGSLTIECWFWRPNVTDSWGVLVADNLYQTAGGWSLYTNTDDIRFYKGGAQIFIVTEAFSAQTWNHIAVQRNSSGDWSCYINGVDQGVSANDSVDFTDNRICIGTNNYSSGYPTQYNYKGYISNVRICKGHNVYTSNFAPPTRELEVHPGPEDDRTVFLACYDGENIFAEKTGKIIAANGGLVSSPTPTSTDSPIGITTFNPGLTRNVDPTAGPTFQGGVGFTSQNWLTLPKGTTEQRFPDFVAVPDSSARGVSVGGLTDASTDVIEYITISTTGNSQDFGDLQQQRSIISGASSNVRGIVVGGYVSPGSNTNTIEYTTIASTGNAQYFGELNLTSNGAQSCSNSTRAVFNKGQTRSLGYVTIATLGNSIDFGTLVNAERNQPGALSNTTRGIWGGGITPANVNAIDFVTIATTGDAVNFGDLTEVKHGLKGFSSSTRGVWGGGDLSPALSNVIEYITIASLGNSQNFGDLTVARRNSGATSSKTRGVWMGADYSPANLNVIDYVTIATTGDAVDFGDLITAKGGGAFSNAHGGLG